MKVDTASERSLLVATDLTRAYRGGKGVFNIRLRLAAGEVVGVMGPNGSGKTTLLRLLATAATPTSGQVSWFGSTNARASSCRPSATNDGAQPTVSVSRHSGSSMVAMAWV